MRISVADITAPAPFSAFPGIDRWLYLIAGGPVTLDLADRPRCTLHAPGDRVAFAGEDTVAATEVARPSRDLNLMVRRATMTARSDLARPGGHGHAVFAISGHILVEDRVLAPLELAWSPDRPLAIRGSGLAVAFAFTARE